ncbi:MAG: hypothetical protein Q7R95_09555 [bacterium]|nr:hypothetical protein [bacterium]
MLELRDFFGGVAQFIAQTVISPESVVVGGAVGAMYMADGKPFSDGYTRGSLVGFLGTMLRAVACASMPSPNLEFPSPFFPQPTIVKTNFAGNPTPTATKTIAYENLKQPGNLPKELSLFSIGTRATPEVNIALQALITDPKQRDLISYALLDNYATNNAYMNELRNYALNNGLAIGLSGCSDSRFTAPFIFPTTQSGIELSTYLNNTLGIALQGNMIGTQPAIFDKRVKMSLFVPHVNCAGATEGCGAAGGIKELLAGNEKKLLEHGVTQGTIDQLKDMINKMGATPNAKAWGKDGAFLQAKMNYLANGENHFVAWGVNGIADDTFDVLGVIDAFGNEYKITDEKFTLLKQYADYLNKPHAILGDIVKKQMPGFNLINGSKRSSSELFKNISQQKEAIFKVGAKVDGTSLTIEQIRSYIKGGEYSLATLQQNGNILVLVADDITDMAKIRTTLLAESTAIQAFIANGGIIVELMPNAEGRFADVMAVRNKFNLAKEFSLARGFISAEAKIDASLIKEAEAIINMKKSFGFLSDAQATKIIKALYVLKPIGQVLNFGLRVVSDIALAQAASDWLSSNIFHENMECYIPPIPNIHYISQDKRKNIPIDEGYRIEREDGVNPFLASGLIDSIDVSVSLMQKNWDEVDLAYQKHGPTSKDKTSSYKDIFEKEKLGGLLKIKIPQIDSADGSIDTHAKNYQSLEEEHIFSLMVQPEMGEDGSFKYRNDDPNQKMMLRDTQTGMRILIDPEDVSLRGAVTPKNSPNIAFSVSPKHPGFVNLWQVIPDPVNKKFTLKYLRTSKIQN